MRIIYFWNVEESSEMDREDFIETLTDDVVEFLTACLGVATLRQIEGSIWNPSKHWFLDLKFVLGL